MPPKKKGVNVIVTGATHRQMDTYDKTINGVKYTLFVPQRDCHNEMGKPYSRTINDIARRENYAQNGDEPDKWIAAIQKVFDNHYDEIKDVHGYKDFHQKKVYFLNPRAGERGFCTYIAVQRKPYKDQTGDAKKKPKRNKTRKKAPAKGKKGKVSEDGSGFIPAASTSSKKGKTKMTDKAKAAKKYMGEMFDSNDSEADDDGWDDIMKNLKDRKWNPKTKDYEEIPEMTLGSLGKSSSSSSLELLSESDSDANRSVDSDGSGAGYFDYRGFFVPETRQHRQRRFDRIEQEEEERIDMEELERAKAYQRARDHDDGIFSDPEEQAAYDAEEDEIRRAAEEEEAEEQRRREILNLEYARANGWSKQKDKEGTIFYTHSKSGATVVGNKDGLLEPHLAYYAYEKAMDNNKTMSSSSMTFPNANTEAPKPWILRTSRGTGKKYWYNPITEIAFYSTKPGGVWTKEEADEAAERAKKKGGRKSRKKKKKTRRKKGGKRKKTKKRKLRKKRKTRR